MLSSSIQDISYIRKQIFFINIIDNKPHHIWFTCLIHCSKKKNLAFEFLEPSRSKQLQRTSVSNVKLTPAENYFPPKRSNCHPGTPLTSPKWRIIFLLNPPAVILAPH